MKEIYCKVNEAPKQNDVSEREERLQELLDNSLRTFAMMVLARREITESDIETFLKVVIPELSEIFNPTGAMK